MAPSQAAHVNLSPAELSFLRATLSQTPPIRLDHTKGPKDFRSMRAEYDVLPGAYGSARIALEDGTEALVGVKAEIEKSKLSVVVVDNADIVPDDVDMKDAGDVDNEGKGQNSWVEISVEIPGFREDDSLPVFLASMLTESLLASGELKDRLYINSRFHWKLYIDVSRVPRGSGPLSPSNRATGSSPLSTAILPTRSLIHDHPPRPTDNQTARAQV